MPPKRKPANDSLRGKVKPHDPFELIRWLAYSQPDPRKALAELVQNSLDAGARNVRVTRLRVKGTPCLRIWDDGDGVIPEFERPEALRFIATNIGHSRKRNLSLQERHTLMTQGQYGIGLLGFWSLGERLEMRTSVPGQQPMRLVLHRDEQQYEIEPLRGRLLRDVNLVYEDHMSRGTAQKVVTVRPRRFLGEKLAGFDTVEVPGHGPIRLELHLRGAAAPNGEDDADDSLAVYAAAEAFTHALAALEPALAAMLSEIERRRAEELDRSLIRDLQRAAGGQPEPARASDTDLEDQLVSVDALPPVPTTPPGDVAPGPLDHAAIAPVHLRIPCGGRRTATARALDIDGRPIAETFRCRWQLEPPGIGRLEPETADAPEIAVVGADAPAEGTLRLHIEVDGPPRPSSRIPARRGVPAGTTTAGRSTSPTVTSAPSPRNPHTSCATSPRSSRRRSSCGRAAIRGWRGRSNSWWKCSPTPT